MRQGRAFDRNIMAKGGKTCRGSLRLPICRCLSSLGQLWTTPIFAGVKVLPWGFLACWESSASWLARSSCPLQDYGCTITVFAAVFLISLNWALTAPFLLFFECCRILLLTGEKIPIEDMIIVTRVIQFWKIFSFWNSYSIIYIYTDGQIFDSK